MHLLIDMWPADNVIYSYSAISVLIWGKDIFQRCDSPLQ